MTSEQIEVTDAKLVKQLREYKPYRLKEEWFGPPFCGQAADRIEALQAEVTTAEERGRLQGMEEAAGIARDNAAASEEAVADCGRTEPHEAERVEIVTAKVIESDIRKTIKKITSGGKAPESAAIAHKALQDTTNG